ncbi:double-stranded RNA-binding protein 1-like [Actinidia eriantha]|uniref:double-stranded RNA-binding protein 1-like n=1 Tax=Actinidia eriantha TaxID=165200 RepID=UPI00258D46DA|nr:double-stranded RNA-binding protein 1-like [Actinidia eriantha]
MYKSKLQELCQQKSWDLPEYSTAREGLDHTPRFTATVTINGVPFQTPDQSRNAKEAQNKAAKLALDHFSLAPSPKQPSPISALSNGFPASITNLDIRPFTTGISQPTMIETMPSLVTSQPTMIETMPPLVKEMPFPVKDDKKLIDMRYLYKNRLQSYAQKRNLALPEYLTERDGPPHASRFKSKVTMDGNTYESPHFFPTIKESEHAAAKVALESLSIDEVQEDDSGLYKNLLQELAQKKGLHIPKYATTNSGPPHMPSFVSTVEIGGQSFEGKAAKSKKQAETNAAKIAYSGLQEPKESVSSGRASLGPTILPSGCQLTEALKVSSSILQSVINDDLQESIAPRHKFIIHKDQDEEYIDGNEEKLSSKLTPANAEFSSHRAPTPPPDADIDTKRPRYLPSSRDSVYSSLRDPFPSDPFTLSSSSPKAARSECSNNLSMGLTDEPPVRAGATNIVPREKILVYPRTPNMKLPEGATVLPFSDDKWVALKVNSSV